MTAERPAIGQIVPDASLIVKWYSPSENGWQVADACLGAFLDGRLRLVAPEHLKVEVVRVLQLGVRDRRFSLDEGLERVTHFLTLPIVYVENDLLFEDAFRIATQIQMALYDAVYLALADSLSVPLVTADRRAYNLAQQRGIRRVVWFEDFTPP